MGEAVLAGAVLVLGLFVAVQTALVEVAPTQARVGPRLFPFLVAAGLLVVGAALLREALAGHIAHEQGFELDGRAVALISAGLLVELLLLEWAGWIIAATLLFVLAARAFMSRRLLVDLMLGLALAALTFLVFAYGLDLSLPVGTAIEPLLSGSEPAS